MVRSFWVRVVVAGLAGAGVAGWLDAAQDGLDADHQLGRAEGLGQVVVGALLEADDALGQGAARGQHQHRHVAIGAEQAHDLEAVDLGQHQVEHDEGRVLGTRLAQGLAAVVGGDDAEALAFEVGAHEGHDLAVVVDDEDGPGGQDRLGVGL